MQIKQNAKTKPVGNSSYVNKKTQKQSWIKTHPMYSYSRIAKNRQCLAVYFPCEVKGSQIDSQPLHALPGKLSSLYIGLEVQILQYNNKKIKKYNPGICLKIPGFLNSLKWYGIPGLGTLDVLQSIPLYWFYYVLVGIYW